jgi:hypothetical protein
MGPKSLAVLSGAVYVMYMKTAILYTLAIFLSAASQLPAVEPFSAGLDGLKEPSENVPVLQPKAVYKRADTEETVRPRYEEKCIFHAVASKMRIVISEERPAPGVYYASDIRVSRFAEAIQEQWGMTADRISNVYVVKTNEIYLADKAVYYAAHNRSIDDSLAHEYAHYFQVTYQGYTLEDMDDTAESQAVAVQTWFRENYISKAPERDLCSF